VHRLEQFVAFPSEAFLFAFGFLLSAIFSIVIAAKYNSVRVFNRKIRTQNISNTLWILYYLATACRAACDGVRYGLTSDLDNSMLNIFLLISLILHGVTCFCLCLALNHQRKYRSSVSASSNPGAQHPNGNANNANNANSATSISGSAREVDPLIVKYSSFKKFVGASEVLFFLLLLLYLIFLYLQIMKSSTIFEILFICAFGLQRFPILLLVVTIAFSSPQVNSTDGPTTQSKIFVCVAALINVLGDVPLQFWAHVLPGGCIFIIASWVDLIHLLQFLSLVFFFLFLRSEYLRNMEETIWTTVSQIQDTFDFRRFN